MMVQFALNVSSLRSPYCDQLTTGGRFAHLRDALN
jgi:hypothetical protein